MDDFLGIPSTVLSQSRDIPLVWTPQRAYLRARPLVRMLKSHPTLLCSYTFLLTILIA